MQSRTPIKILSFLAGCAIALFGGVFFHMAATGVVKSGQDFIYAAGAGFLIVATPLIAFAFSTKLAKRCAVLVLIAFAVLMVWLAFRPGLPLQRPVLAQVAAISLAVLLIARVGLALRRSGT